MHFHPKDILKIIFHEEADPSGISSVGESDLERKLKNQSELSKKAIDKFFSMLLHKGIRP